MSKFFVSLKRWRNNPATVLIVYLCWFGTAIISAYLCYANYITSVQGYHLIPIRNAAVPIETMAPLVGALPLLVQCATGAVAIEKKNRLAGLICCVCFVVDVATCVISLAVDYTFLGIASALFFSIFLYTLFAEVMLVMSVENLIGNSDDAAHALMLVIGKIMGIAIIISSRSAGGVVDTTTKLLVWLNNNDTKALVHRNDSLR